MKFEKYINCLKEHLLTRNYSERTISSYCDGIKKFIIFIEENYPRIHDITGITKDTLADYVSYLTCYKDKKDKSLSSKTIKLKIISLRIFFKYLIRFDYILSNPTTQINLPREEKDLPRNILTEEEVKLILSKINTNTPIRLRNKAVIELFYSTGMRTSELVNLKISDVDLKEQVVIIVLGKGNKTRVVPIGQHACYYIEQYLEKARKFMLKGKLKDEGYLFLTVRGCKFDKCSINKSLISEVMKNVRINKKVSCYTFRHSIATHLVKNKVDIRFVSQLLGHESLKTTQKYVHLEISDLKKVMSMYHPREACNNPIDNDNLK